MSTMLGRKIFAKRQESHWKYMFKLYWPDIRDVGFGVISGLLAAVALYFSL